MKHTFIGILTLASLSATANDSYNFRITEKVEEVSVQGSTDRYGTPFSRSMTAVLTDSQVRYDFNYSTIISCSDNRLVYRNNTTQKLTVNLTIPVQGSGSRGRPCSKLELCLNHMTKGESIQIEASKTTLTVNRILVPESCIGVIDDTWRDYNDAQGFGKYRLTIDQADLL